MITSLPDITRIIKREGIRPNYYLKSFIPSHFFPQFVFQSIKEKDEIPIYVHKHNSKILLHSYVGDLRTAYSERTLFNFHILVNTSNPSPNSGNSYSIRQVVMKISHFSDDSNSFPPALITVVSNDNFINIYDSVSHPGLLALIFFNRHITTDFLSKQSKAGLKVPNNKQIIRIQSIDDSSLLKAMNDDYEKFQKYNIQKSFYQD